MLKLGALYVGRAADADPEHGVGERIGHAFGQLRALDELVERQPESIGVVEAPTGGLRLHVVGASEVLAALDGFAARTGRRQSD